MKNSLLIAYYSYMGHTRRIAEEIHEATGGVVFEIRPEQEYPADYDTCVAQAQREIRSAYLPPLIANCDSFSVYDTIILGTPNWFNTMAPPVATFLSTHDLSGKKVLPLCTHGGGGLAHVARDIQKLAKGATTTDCLTLYEGEIDAAAEKIRAWLKANRLV